ncbi:hypothetical protein [Frigoriglobus tundricola]|uniref:Uncharacterized protein n=1 Tax=Frigoriglobus tundricola TaxID=2774151 RepID=A0A6M5YI92_9BACT|nr:hypothetical protein [Frigoriglobus tundricola]QJW93755.1 hypothetical protein FTUN_1266 [Frigoriglobus tundricola]
MRSGPRRGRVRRVIAIVYHLVGKWGTVFTLMGVYCLREKPRGDEDG